ncbi:hypothetical protein O3P69_018746 [Scylla paramamosain]|uniref:Uncharacterized protein n=1 Tax=Scylla paramamosain TaxID=85552 RepID=A0AAW0SUS3_SCYPA
MGSEQHYSLRWNDYTVKIVTAFQSLRDEEDFVDVTVACDGHSYSAHKMVLSACSPYFRSLLRANPCQHPIVILKDVGHVELERLLEFMYNGEVSIAQDQLAAFLKTAENLKIRGLAGSSDEMDQAGVSDYVHRPDVSYSYSSSSALGGGVTSDRSSPSAGYAPSQSSKDDEMVGEGYHRGDSPPAKRRKRSSAPAATSAAGHADSTPASHTTEGVAGDSSVEVDSGGTMGGGGLSGDDDGRLDRREMKSEPAGALVVAWATLAGEGGGVGGGVARPLVGLADGRGDDGGGGGGAGSRLYPCPECDKVFRHPRSYYQHQHVHRGTHSCPGCRKLFSRRWDLLRHLNKNKYGCPARWREGGRHPPYHNSLSLSALASAAAVAATSQDALPPGDPPDLPLPLEAPLQAAWGLASAAAEAHDAHTQEPPATTATPGTASPPPRPARHHHHHHLTHARPPPTPPSQALHPPVPLPQCPSLLQCPSFPSHTPTPRPPPRRAIPHCPVPCYAPRPGATPRRREGGGRRTSRHRQGRRHTRAAGSVCPLSSLPHLPDPPPTRTVKTPQREGRRS